MKKIITLCLLSLCLLPSCVNPITVGAAVGTGLIVAQERDFWTVFSDTRIQAKINDLWFRYNVDAFGKLDMTVNNGRVLLTGVVQDPDHRVEAVRLAWQPVGVKQVINEIRVAESGGVTSIAKDQWISAQLRTKLTLDKEISAINYSIDTVEGVVYLIGAAQSREELNRVIETARTIAGVQQVVSYVKISDGRDD